MRSASLNTIILVEQQQARRRGERDRALELPLLAMREISRENLASLRQSKIVEGLLRGLDQRRIAAGVAPEPEAVPGVRLNGERHVLQHPEVWRDAGDLERACKPEARAPRRGKGGDVGAGEAHRARI